MSKSAVQLLTALRVEVLTHEADFDAIKDDWDELLDESNQCMYFLRWSWNRLWWRAYAPLNSRLYLIVCHDSSGQLVGLAPLYWRRLFTAGVSHLKEVLFLGTGIQITTSEHLDLIARRGYERAVGEAIASFVLRDNEVERLWLSEIPITSVVLPHLRRAIGGRQSVRVCDRSHCVDTLADWETLRRDLSKSMRANLGYYTRRLFKLHDCKFGSVETKEDLARAMDDLVRLHQARWRSKGEPGSFSLPGFEWFLREAIQSSFAEGRLRLWTLAVDGQTAAVLLAFLDNGTAHYFQGGFDPHNAKDSLGNVMLGLCLRACTESDDIVSFDFMGGDAPHKEHWTKSGQDSVVLEWLRPGIRSSFFRIRESGQSVGKSFLRRIMPAAVRFARQKRIQGK